MTHTPEQIAQIAGKMTDAQREAFIDARWIHAGGQEPIALVDFNGVPWPQGVCEFFAFRRDKLTPLGIAIRQYLLEKQ